MIQRSRQLMRASVLALAAACLPLPLLAQTAAPAPAQSATSEESLPVEPGEGRAVALKLAGELVRGFVYRDQAEAYASMLKANAAAGRYDRGTRGELAKLM